MEAVIADNSLQKKVRFVVTDNASNKMKAMSVLFHAGDASCIDPNADPSLWEDMDADEYESVFASLPARMSCFAHSLQLVVREGGLAAMGVIRCTLVKCSKLANLVLQSALFRSVFEAELGTGKAIPVTNDTRWNSTYRLTGLYDRLSHVFEALGIRRSPHLPPLDRARQLQFDNNIMLMAAVLDPTFGFQWLQDHPESVEETHDLQQRITG